MGIFEREARKVRVCLSFCLLFLALLRFAARREVQRTHTAGRRGWEPLNIHGVFYRDFAELSERFTLDARGHAYWTVAVEWFLGRWRWLLSRRGEGGKALNDRRSESDVSELTTRITQDRGISSTTNFCKKFSVRRESSQGKKCARSWRCVHVSLAEAFSIDDVILIRLPGAVARAESETRSGPQNVGEGKYGGCDPSAGMSVRFRSSGR